MTKDEAFTVRCRQIIRSLPVQYPFDERAFFAAVARQRGKRIDLIPAPPAAGIDMGMLVCTADVDYIVRRTDTTELHALHSDMHEFSHLVLEHGHLPMLAASAVAAEARTDGVAECRQPADEWAGACGAADAAADATVTALHVLLPGLSPRLIRRILGRTLYETREEWEAETLATLLMVEIHHPGRGGAESGDLADHLGHLHASCAGMSATPWWRV